MILPWKMRSSTISLRRKTSKHETETCDSHSQFYLKLCKLLNYTRSIIEQNSRCWMQFHASESTKSNNRENKTSPPGTAKGAEMSLWG